MGKLWIVALAATLVGCATAKELVPIGGSRADGTVQLAYEYGAFEKPVVDREAAQQSAMQRCRAWGYTSAEPFGGGQQRCLANNQYGCVRMQVTVSYQCTGGAPP